jgi:hypothetical protein
MLWISDSAMQHIYNLTTGVIKISGVRKLNPYYIIWIYEEWHVTI